jgi:hypothetical protein
LLRPQPQRMRLALLRLRMSVREQLPAERLRKKRS